MNNELKVFFENISKNLKDSPGSIDVIATTGTSILSGDPGQWIDFGISNISEISISLQDIKDILKNYETSGVSEGIILDNLFPIMQDLSYHSAIFGVYYFAFENSFQNNMLDNDILKIQRAELNGITKETDFTEQPLKKLLQSILAEAINAEIYFKAVFLNENADKLAYLYKLQRSLLTLQIFACDLKKNWWLR